MVCQGASEHKGWPDNSVPQNLVVYHVYHHVPYYLEQFKGVCHCSSRHTPGSWKFMNWVDNFGPFWVWDHAERHKMVPT